MDAVSFFDVILPARGLRCLALPGKHGFQHLFGETNAWLAEASVIADTRKQINTYFGCATYKDRSSRKKTNVEAVRSFWADIDCGQGKPYLTKRDGATELLAFVRKLGLSLPYIVSSGNGLHAYWPMTADMDGKTWAATAMILKAAMKVEGLKADPSRTSDEASVLRPPGTHHRKKEPTLVKVVVEGHVTPLAAFQELLLPYAKHVDLPSEEATFDLEGTPAIGLTAEMNSDLMGGMEQAVSSAHAIADKCGVIDLIRQTKGKVDQPTWYFGLGVLAFTEEGDAICHEWSSGDPRYSHDETQRKLNQIRANQKPTSCAKLGDHQPEICAACPHAGKIKTPWTLGLQQPEPVETRPVVTEQVRRANGTWNTVNKAVEPPFGFRFMRRGNHPQYMAYCIPVELDDGSMSDTWEEFCSTLVIPITRLWIEGVAYVECEMELKGNEKRRFLIEGGTIGKGKDTLAAELARNEIVCKPGKAIQMDSYLKAWMTKLKDEASQVVAHRHFGWEEGSFVLGEDILHPGSETTRAVLVGMAKSKSEALVPRGNLETWVDVVDKVYNAPGQEGFQFLVVSAFAAPLLSMLDQVAGVTIYAHSEGSGVGKTTAQKVGLSAWGDWDELMLADAKVTQNALWGLMGAYHSLPIVFDELTNTKNDVASELVFSVSSGRSKQRMRSDGELRENNSNWCTIMLASGNNLLSEKLALHRGNAEAEISRLFEYTLTATPHLTPNEANALFPLLRTHYGHAGRTFAAYVVDNQDAIRAMLMKAQASINDSQGITQVERYWSALLASVMVALAICRSIGLLSFDQSALRRWMFDRLAENRVGRNEASSDPLDLLGSLLADHWEGVLVTHGEGDLRKGVVATVVQKPRGIMSGRAIIPVGNNERPILMLNVQVIRDWSNKKGVSAREIFNAAVRAGWADPALHRYSLGRGTLEYSSTSTYLNCWKLDPDKIAGQAAGRFAAQKLGVIDGGQSSGAGTAP